MLFWLGVLCREHCKAFMRYCGRRNIVKTKKTHTRKIFSNMNIKALLSNTWKKNQDLVDKAK